MVNEALPPDLQIPDDDTEPIDKKRLQKILAQVAAKYPDQYKDISYKLMRIAGETVSMTGGYGVGLRHMKRPLGTEKYELLLQARVLKIMKNPRLTPEEKKKAVIDTTLQIGEQWRKAAFDAAIKEENPLALQALSGTRGNPGNAAAFIASELLFTDANENVIPVPVFKNYAQGLTPSEYFAGAYGARKGVVDVKIATANAGYFGKQLNQLAHRLVVTGIDDDDDDEDENNQNKVYTTRGFPVKTDDPDNEGALLARDTGKYKKNTILTPKILQELKESGHEEILIRSPLVGGSKDGGLLARDLGLNEQGRFYDLGTIPGMLAAQAIAEPISQGQLSSKHSGGAAGAGKEVSGFKYLQALVAPPKIFPGGATHAETDGVVQKIVPAIGGGSIITVSGKEHYAPAGINVKVKPGQSVEAGDVLTEGLPNPNKVVEHKGIGEGRRYFVSAFYNAMKNAGLPVHRRNVEIITRGLIDHVELDEEIEDFVPGDIVSYQQLEKKYKPREGTQRRRVDGNLTGYLETPVLHYSIGTKIRPSVVAELKKFGIEEIDVHDQPPFFRPKMVRSVDTLKHDPDPITRMYGSGLKASLLDSVARGGVSDTTGTSFVPALAKAVDFGKTGPLQVRELPPPAVDLNGLKKTAYNSHSNNERSEAAFTAGMAIDPGSVYTLTGGQRRYTSGGDFGRYASGGGNFAGGGSDNSSGYPKQSWVSRNLSFTNPYLTYPMGVAGGAAGLYAVGRARNSYKARYGPGTTQASGTTQTLKPTGAIRQFWANHAPSRLQNAVTWAADTVTSTMQPLQNAASKAYSYVPAPVRTTAVGGSFLAGQAIKRMADIGTGASLISSAADNGLAGVGATARSIGRRESEGVYNLFLGHGLIGGKSGLESELHLSIDEVLQQHPEIGGNAEHYTMLLLPVVKEINSANLTEEQKQQKFQEAAAAAGLPPGISNELYMRLPSMQMFMERNLGQYGANIANTVLGATDLAWKRFNPLTNVTSIAGNTMQMQEEMAAIRDLQDFDRAKKLDDEQRRRAPVSMTTMQELLLPEAARRVNVQGINDTADEAAALIADAGGLLLQGRVSKFLENYNPISSARIAAGFAQRTFARNFLGANSPRETTPQQTKQPIISAPQLSPQEIIKQREKLLGNFLQENTSNPASVNLTGSFGFNQPTAAPSQPSVFLHPGVNQYLNNNGFYPSSGMNMPSTAPATPSFSDF